jgi:hypothetical protein
VEADACTDRSRGLSPTPIAQTIAGRVGCASALPAPQPTLRWAGNPPPPTLGFVCTPTHQKSKGGDSRHRSWKDSQMLGVLAPANGVRASWAVVCTSKRSSVLRRPMQLTRTQDNFVTAPQRARTYRSSADSSKSLQRRIGPSDICPTTWATHLTRLARTTRSQGRGRAPKSPNLTTDVTGAQGSALGS